MKNEGACAVRTKVIGYVLAAAAALGAAQTAHAAWGWKGAGSDSYWSTAANWNKGLSGKGYYFRSSLQPYSNYLVSIDNFYQLTQHLYVDKGTSESNPIVFSATTDDSGLDLVTSSKNIAVALEEVADGYLKITRGTYRASNVQIGQDVDSNGFKGWLCLDSSDGNVTLSTASNFYLHDGSIASTNANVSVGNRFRIGRQNGAVATVVKKGGDWTVGEQFRIAGETGTTGSFTMDGGTLEVTGNLYVGTNKGFVKGDLTLEDGTITAKAGTYVAFAGEGSGPGTFTMNGGTYKAQGSFVVGNASTAKAVVALNGGVLETKGMTVVSGADSSVAFNGGKVMATQGGTLIQAGISVTTGANGATLDAVGFDVTIAADIADKTGESGTVKFVGDGGTVRLNGAVSYSGATLLNEKTHLVVKDRAMLETILSHGLTLTKPSGSSKGTFTLISIADGSACTEADYGLITKESGLEGAEFGIENGAITVTVSHFAQTWAGAAGVEANWSGENWDDGVSFDMGNDAVFATSNAIAVVDEPAEAFSVTFSESATLTGSATLTVPVVSVASGAEALISAPVAGPLEKTGAGTLTLGASRSESTALTEGTLVMSGIGTVLDWSKINFTTYPSVVPAGNVALKFENGATASSVQNIYIGNDDGATAELHKDGGDWNVSWNVVLAQGKNATARFYHRGGTMTLARYIRLGFNPESNASDTYFEISGGTVSDTRSSNTGYMSIGDSGLPGCRSVMAVKTGGSYTAAENLVVGNAAAGTLNVEGGTVSVANGVTYLCSGTGCTEGEDCSINITDGGTLVAKTIRHGSSDTAFGAAMSSLTFDVGTLKAASSGTLVYAHDNLTVTVGAGGGAIDSNGNVVTIEEELTGTGSMTFKGGGKVTLTHLPAYSGSTIVEAGTVLELPSAIAGEKLVFTDKEGIEDGLCPAVMITGDGMFPADVVDKAQKAVGVGLYLSADKKTIYCVHGDSNTTSVWIGGTSSSLDDSDNWFARSVPDGGNVIIGGLVETEITNPERSSFSADFITVPSYSEAVTVDGAPISGIYAITNNSPNPIEFKNVVEFVNDIDVVQNTGAVIFTGGATGNTLARATDIYGTYTLTASGTNIVEWGGTVVKDGGAYLLPNATFFKNNGDFSVEEGGRAEVMAAKINRQTDARLLDKLEGEFKVNGEFAASASGASGRVTHYVCNGGGVGTLIVNGLRVNQNAALVPPRLPGKMVVGEGGIVRGNGYVRVYNSGSHEVGSCADWTMYHDNLGNTNTQGYVFYKHSSSTQSDLVFDTTDYYDNTIGRTITSEAPICAANDDSAAKFSVTVKGKGAFVFANTSVDSDSGKLFAGGLVVTNTATVTVNPGSRPGNGPITVHDGATLKVVQPESDALTLGGGLTLASGASLGFHFTRREVEPFLDLENTEVTFADESSKNITIRLSSVQKGASGDCIRPIAGEFALTSGGKFSGVSVSLAEDSPKWAKEVKVNDDGDIEVTITAGYYLLLR